MECSGYYAQESGLLGTRWRGVRFENARHKKDLVQEHTLYVKVNTLLLFPNGKPQLAPPLLISGQTLLAISADVVILLSANDVTFFVF